MYFPTIDIATGRLLRLAMTPTRIQRLRINRTWDGDARWLIETLNRQGKKLGTRAESHADNTLLLQWG
jgi:poly-gamma-glutamate capsule biosynthesis protein CapA/YwtB (metallophosphatase superfamily)